MEGRVSAVGVSLLLLVFPLCMAKSHRIPSASNREWDWERADKEDHREHTHTHTLA